MSRPILSLWRYLFQAGIGFLVILQLPLMLKKPIGDRPWMVAFVCCVGCLVAIISFWRSRWLWRMIRKVRRFETKRCRRFVMHRAHDLVGVPDATAFLQHCELELERLERQFGLRIRRRVVVYLFSHHGDVADILGSRYGGAALWPNVILIADDNDPIASMKHELAHMFSLRWNPHAPPLLSEGLSVWWQQSYWGVPIDLAAKLYGTYPGVKLRSLLNHRYFFRDPQRRTCYLLAGSFTGFLIRQYGWDRYQKLYVSCNGWRFQAKFRKHIGVAFDKAEWHWRNESLVGSLWRHRANENFCD